MRHLAMFVVKAAGMSMNEGLSNNAVVRDFNEWISRFETKRICVNTIRFHQTLGVIVQIPKRLWIKHQMIFSQMNFWNQPKAKTL